jgi:leader peptidase (prepilin peptidase)/N-methyltransferase
MIETVPPLFWIAAAGAFGAVIGSFLNVCIHRLPIGSSIVWPSSACPHCARELSWYENIRIRYPLVEALTAAMFAAAWWYYGPEPLFASRIIFGCALVVLFAIDLEHHLLPNAITLPGIVVGFAFSFFTEPGWIASLIGLLAGGGALYLIALAYFWVRHEEGLGMGDPKMLAMIGAFLGWKLTLVTLMIASLTGSVVGLGMMAAGRGTMKYALPFGCFLAVGAVIAATVGPPLLDWYLGLF